VSYEDESDFRRFFRHVCDYGDRIRVLFAISLTFLIVSAVGIVVIEPGTASWVLTVLNTVVLGFLVIFFGVVIRACARVAP
jgi:hypothetical protein